MRVKAINGAYAIAQVPPQRATPGVRELDADGGIGTGECLAKGLVRATGSYQQKPYWENASHDGRLHARRPLESSRARSQRERALLRRLS
ncbi:MAG: hypothetical protein NVS4B3_11190 [Gemmatimonadaceae bacterium]